jgi:hypothetical protein
LKGQYKIRIGDEIFFCEEGVSYLPSRVPRVPEPDDEPGEIVVVYTPEAAISSMRNWARSRGVNIRIERRSPPFSRSTK